MPVTGYGVVIAVNFFLQAVIESSLPDVDDFIGAARDEVVALPAKLGGVGVGLQGVLKLTFLRVPDLCSSVLG